MFIRTIHAHFSNTVGDLPVVHDSREWKTTHAQFDEGTYLGLAFFIEFRCECLHPGSIPLLERLEALSDHLELHLRQTEIEFGIEHVGLRLA